MNKGKYGMTAALLSLLMLTGCSRGADTAQFQQTLDKFCSNLSELNSSINNVNSSDENAAEQVLGYLDQVNEQFQSLAELDFPEEFDYLEPLAAEAAEYMAVAAENYRMAFADGGYDEALDTYARENSARALKRIQVILSCLRGEQS